MLWQQVCACVITILKRPTITIITPERSTTHTDALRKHDHSQRNTGLKRACTIGRRCYGSRCRRRVCCHNMSRLQLAVDQVGTNLKKRLHHRRVSCEPTPPPKGAAYNYTLAHAQHASSCALNAQTHNHRFVRANGLGLGARFALVGKLLGAQFHCGVRLCACLRMRDYVQMCITRTASTAQHKWRPKTRPAGLRSRVWREGV